MPHITAAMERSVRRGVSDLLFDSLLGRRGITDTVGGVKNTFSSWGNCMQATYCKWPVIAAIIVVSLMVFSILWCIVRCACCGMSCCCACFSFLKCCDCCGGCCDGKKEKQTKHLDDPYTHHDVSNGGYKPPTPMPMMGGGLGGKPAPPQYAQFEVGKSGLAVDSNQAALSEDALPPMPSWETANKKHVTTDGEKNAMELGELNPSTGQKMPLIAGGVAPGTSMPPSPVHEMGATPYGARPGQGNINNSVAGETPFAQNQAAFHGNGGYRGSPSPGLGRRPSPQDAFSQNGSFVGAAGAPGPGYGRGPIQRGYSGESNNRGPPQRQFPGQDGPGRGTPQPSRQYSNESARPLVRQHSDLPYTPNNDNYAPNGPQSRGPSRGPGPGPMRMVSPPINNNSGFDFGTGSQQPFSRPPPTPQQPSYGSGPGRRPSPPQDNYNGGHDGYAGSTAPPTYASRSPPQEPAYPGFRAYQPPQQPATSHNRAPTALRPGAGREPREPQGWDPVNH